MAPKAREDRDSNPKTVGNQVNKCRNTNQWKQKIAEANTHQEGLQDSRQIHKSKGSKGAANSLTSI